MELEKSILFAKSHEWIQAAGDRRKVGISDFAQGQLGDIVFVEFPKPGRKYAAGDEVCIIESCKATASVYAPLAGTLVAVNDALPGSPEKINQSPYEEGWLFQLEIVEPVDESRLMTTPQYEKFCREEA